LRQRGTQQLVGEVLGENRAMLGLCRHLGFAERVEGDVVVVSLGLQGT